MTKNSLTAHEDSGSKTYLLLKIPQGAKKIKWTYSKEAGGWYIKSIE